MTKGSGLNVNGSNDEVNSTKAHEPSRIVTRSHMMVIGQRVSRSCLLLPNRRVSRLMVFDAFRIDSGSPEK